MRELFPCDYHLFPNLKKCIGGKRFSDNSEVFDPANRHFEDRDKSFYETSTTALEHRWAKWIELKGVKAL